jgi:hypothetical protein
MAKRIDVMLPETTILTLDGIAKHFAVTRSAEGLREQLRQTALRDRDLDTKTAQDWVVADHESCQQLDAGENRSKETGREPQPTGSKHCRQTMLKSVKNTIVL